MFSLHISISSVENWESGFYLFSRRELGIAGALGEGAKLESFGRSIIGRRVEVGLSEDDHSDVGVQVNLTRT